jgi:putative ABC transport system permease protein
VIRRTVGGFQAMLTAFALLAVLAGFVICYSRLGAIFEARTWEVGLLRAVGLRRAVVFRELLKESLLLGAAGTAIGVPAGILLGRFGLPVFANATAINFRLSPPVAAPGLDASAIVMGMLVGLLAAVFAAAIPAMRLARKQPVAALTLRGRDAPPVSSRRGWLVGAGLLVASIALAGWQQATRVAGLGNVTTVLVALAACALARPLLLAGGSVLVAQWRWLFGPVGGLAAGHLRQQARRASLTVATLGVGLGAVLMFGVLAWSFERTLTAATTSRVRSDLVISSPFVSGGYRGAPLASSLVDEVAATTGVHFAVGVQESDLQYGDGSVVVYGYDSVCFRDPSVCDWSLRLGALPDALERVIDGSAVVVSSSFARHEHVGPGDVIPLASPTGSIVVTVAGVTDAEVVNSVIMNRDVYRRHWNDSHVSWVWVTLQPGHSLGMVEAAIARNLGEKYRLQIRSSGELVEYFASQARQAFSALYLMEGITFILVLIAIGDTLATGVIERTREFGMMRAIGLRRTRIFGMVVLEGVGIGVFGLLVAAGVGVLLGVFWVEVQFPALLGWSLYLHWPVTFGLTAAVLTLLLCFAGSVLPSLHAARLPLSVALRDE